MFLRAAFIFLTSCVVQGLSYADDLSSIETSPLDRLMAGNQRYVQDRLEHPNRSIESRQATAAMQSPFAAIVGCSDSRVAPEIIFDQGVGDLFIVRVAGNVVGPLETDSIEYAAVYLGAQLIMVLGHEKCGAVDAVVNQQTKDIEAVAALIQPAVNTAKGLPGNVLNNAIKENVRNMVKQIKTSAVITNLIEQGMIDVVGAYYHLESGVVELIE